MAILNLRGKPYPKQVEFFKAKNIYVGYGGSRGGGKSWAARRKALLLALNPDYAGIQILLLRRRYNDVYENHIYPLMTDLYGIKGIRYNDKTKSVDFPWGSRLIFGYCDHEKDVLQYQGKAFDCIFVEEATQFTPFMIQSLTESLRATGIMKSYLNWTPRMYFTMNPGGVGHAYMKRLFIDKSYERSELASDYTFIPSTVYENDFIMTNNPTYIRALENLPEQRKKAMLYGDWDVYEGQFFTDWRNDPNHYKDRLYTNVIDPFPIPQGWKRYMSLDWGYSKPFSIGWYAVNHDDQIFRYREYYGCTGEPDVGVRMTPEQVADEIKRIEGELEEKGTYIHRIADPAIFATDTGKSIAESFMDKGLFFEPGDNSRLSGWNQMRERMKFDMEGRSMFYVFTNCKHFIRTVPSLIHDSTKVEDLDTKQEDHPADECRYLCMSRPTKPRLILPEKMLVYNPLETEKKPNPYGLGIYM